MGQTFFSTNKKVWIFTKIIKIYCRQLLPANCFFAHSENLILSPLADVDHDIRIKSLEIFKLAAESCPNLRKFELTKVNFAAVNLIELLDATSVWYIAQLLKDTSLQAVESVVWTGKADSLIVNVPCHCQAVERHLQL